MGARLFRRSHRAGLLAGGKTTVSPPLNPMGLVFALGAYHLQDRSNESENSEKQTHNMLCRKFKLWATVKKDPHDAILCWPSWHLPQWHISKERNMFGRSDLFYTASTTNP